MSKEWTTLAVTQEQRTEIEERKPDEMAVNAFIMQSVRAKDREVDDLEALAEELTESMDRGRLVGPQVLKKVNELEEKVDGLPEEVALRLRNK